MTDVTAERVTDLSFVLLTASGYVAGTIGTRAVPPITLLTWRFAVAAVALAGIALAVRAPWPRTWAGWRDTVVAGLLLQGVSFAGTYLGLALGLPAGLAALIFGLSPLTVALAGGPLLGERLTGRQWLGSALGVAGVALALSGRLSGPHGWGGVAFALLGVAGFTAGTLYQRGHGHQMHLASGGAIQLGAAAVAFAPIAALHGGLGLPATVPALGALTWLVVANSIGAATLFLLLVRRRSAALATGPMYLVPPVTALVAVPMLGQPLGPTGWLGLATACAGVLLLRPGTPRREHSTKAALART